MCRILAAFFSFNLLISSAMPSVFAAEASRPLDIYFIDVEGGAATLMVTPSGETILVDSGYPDYGGRDKDRILHVLKDVAGGRQIDHAIVTHWHMDHYGNHAAIAAAVPVKAFYDRGIPDALPEDRDYLKRIDGYRAASHNHSTTLRSGDTLPLKAGETPIFAKVMTASGEVIENSGPANPFAKDNQPKPEDTSENAKSISLLFGFGNFRFLCCGDLTWNVEAKLVTPNNPVGPVDVFVITHHGLNVSNNPVFVKAIDPVVTIMCNGPTKGGNLETLKTISEVKSLQAQFQLHRNIKLADDQQAPAKHIANNSDMADCKGRYLRLRVAPDGKSYEVLVEGGASETFPTRPGFYWTDAFRDQ